jgi:hypothetical protein
MFLFGILPFRRFMYINNLAHLAHLLLYKKEIRQTKLKFTKYLLYTEYKKPLEAALSKPPTKRDHF